MDTAYFPVTEDRPVTPSGHVFGNDRPWKPIANESMYDRISRVADICQSPGVRDFYAKVPVIQSRRFYLERTQVCMCTVPKAASTSVKRLLLMAENPEKAEHYRSMPGNLVHAQAPLYETDSCSDKPGFSFFVARNPYERLYSAYIDKVFLEKFDSLSVLLDMVFTKKLSKQLVPMTSSNVIAFAKSMGYFCEVSNTSFEHFLSYVARARTLDPHYTPASLMCNPCDQPVNHIFKQENLVNESRSLVSYLNESLQYNESYKNITLGLSDYAGDGGIENLVLTYANVWKTRLVRNQCKITSTLYHAIWQRLWEGLKILGNIYDGAEYMPEIFEGKGIIFKSSSTILKHFKRASDALAVTSMEERERQRHRYLVEAYSRVSKPVLDSIRQLFQLDFDMFGYDPNPPA